MNVVIVDDERPIMQLCMKVLELQGYTVEGFTRGEDAVARLLASPADLLVVDYKMPGLNGVEVIRRVRAARPNQRAVMITGHGTAEVVAEATEVRVNGLLFKPFTPSELVEAVVAALKP